MKEMLAGIDWKTLGPAVLSWLITVVVLYAIISNLKKIPDATGKLFDWLRQQAGHVKNQFAAGVLDRLCNMAEYAVLAAENIAIEDLKAQAASGKLSPEDLLVALKKVKDDVLAKVKEHATAQNLWQDAVILFNGKDDLLMKWLGDVVEAHVSKLPPSGLQSVLPALEAKGILSAMEVGAEKRTTKPVENSIVGAVTKLLLITLIPLAFLFSAPAYSQEVVPPTDPPAAVQPAAPAVTPTPAPVVGCSGIQCLNYSVGPTIPFLEWDVGNVHPISVAPGAGVQLSLGLDQLQLAIGGKAWDMMSLDFMVFGSLVTNKDGQQMGALSGAAALCTMSSLVCIGGGKHIIETQGGILKGGDGWFMLMSFSFNIALAPKSPPLGIAQGAAGLQRANTIYLGR
jgi:hypothetical protein